MKCRMEENSRLFDVLSALETGYTTGDFGELFPYLAKDVVLQSQWVLTPNTGYDDVVDYFIGKGETLAKHDCFPDCSIVELVGSCNPVKNVAVISNGEEAMASSVGLMYTPGKLAMLMEQTINNETNGVLVDVRIDEDGMVKQIDLCMPELFKYRDFYTYVCFFPSSTDWREGDEYHPDQDHLVRVSEYYYDELYLFLGCAGDSFDEYEDLHIPMERWCNALDYWKEFIYADSFDAAFEIIAGVDYENGTILNPDAAKRLGSISRKMWENRYNSKSMLEGLREWTALYKDSYAFVDTYGW